jgi:hypothetical protein
MKARVFIGLTAMIAGCAAPTASWRGAVEWPETGRHEQSVKTIIPSTEAGAALAAAAAIRELVKTHPFPGLFDGCSSPEQGLGVAVFTGPTPGLYYVVLEQRFHQCGGPVGRVLDWDYVYAVTPQGEVVAEAPPPSAVGSAKPEANASAPASTPEVAPSPASPQLDNGGTAAPTEIRWPENLAPLMTLDGDAIVAASTALRHVLAQKVYPAGCEPTAESFQITVGYQEPLYYVRIEARAERCGQGGPGVEPLPGWFRVYALGPGGGMVAPNPSPP